MKEGEAGRGEHGVREGVHCRRKGGHGGREMKEGRHVGGEHGVREGARECWREGRRREGGREIRTGHAGGGGRREGWEGGRHQCSVPGMVMHRSMVVSIHSVLTC